MDFAFIKDTKCINIAVFESQEVVNELYDVLIGDNDYIVPRKEGFGIGDIYDKGVWIKNEAQLLELPNDTSTLDELQEALEILLGGRDNELYG